MNYQEEIESWGPLTRKEITEAVKDPEWQVIRRSLHGRSIKERLFVIYCWANLSVSTRKHKVQALNYLNALKRGGLLK